MKKTRKFNGEIFKLYKSGLTITEARYLKEDLKFKGKKVRITEDSKYSDFKLDVYMIWIR